jgi:hypothetical protein
MEKTVKERKLSIKMFFIVAVKGFVNYFIIKGENTIAVSRQNQHNVPIPMYPSLRAYKKRTARLAQNRILLVFSVFNVIRKSFYTNIKYSLS